MPFPDNTFDLVWSMESGEYMPDKRQFVLELARLQARRPRHRRRLVPPRPSARETALSDKEERLLAHQRAYYLPRWCSAADYKQLSAEFGLVDVKTDDWTEAVRRFGRQSSSLLCARATFWAPAFRLLDAAWRHRHALMIRGQRRDSSNSPDHHAQAVSCEIQRPIMYLVLTAGCATWPPRSCRGLPFFLRCCVASRVRVWVWRYGTHRAPGLPTARPVMS